MNPFICAPHWWDDVQLPYKPTPLDAPSYDIPHGTTPAWFSEYLRKCEAHPGRDGQSFPAYLPAEDVIDILDQVLYEFSDD